ncbi:MAG: ribonuclease III [Methanomicrobiales archaeon]|nr:ribonuclease III [Methanomicrobiales archaeon]
MHEETIAALEERIGYAFRNRRLPARALTRLAYAQEQGMPPGEAMDALATLGDAVISLVVIEALLREGGHDKGVITTAKVDAVNMTRLRRAAEDLHLEAAVAWGRGERIQHIWTSGRVLAECLEALVGALYLDGGIAAAAALLERLDLAATKTK